jgi:hypothetical protein
LDKRVSAVERGQKLVYKRAKEAEAAMPELVIALLIIG